MVRMYKAGLRELVGIEVERDEDGTIPLPDFRNVVRKVPGPKKRLSLPVPNELATARAPIIKEDPTSYEDASTSSESGDIPTPVVRLPLRPGPTKKQKTAETENHEQPTWLIALLDTQRLEADKRAEALLLMNQRIATEAADREYNRMQLLHKWELEAEERAAKRAQEAEERAAKRAEEASKRDQEYKLQIMQLKAEILKLQHP